MLSGSPDSPAPHSGPGWRAAPTPWSVVIAAGRDPARRQAALERLCRLYWTPVYVFLRSRGSTHHDAEDLAQSFFAELCEGDALRRADPARGRFRGYLLTLLKHHVSARRRLAQRKKRAGAWEIVPLDAAMLEAGYAQAHREAEEPGQSYDRAWAHALLHAARESLRAEQAAAGHAARCEVLLPFLSRSPGTGEYAQLATQLGIARGQVALQVHRLQRKYRDHLLAAVRETVSDPTEAEDELRAVLATIES